MQATLPLPGPVVMPMPTGSLEAYIQTVNRFPILSADEERALALRYRDHEDLEAARGLVLSHLRLVVALARGYLEGAAGVPETHWAAGVDEAIACLRTVLRPGDCILLKGSRAVGLEAVAEALTSVPA